MEGIIMLRSIDDFIGYHIQAQDGDIGKVDNFYFDDREWTIRYLIADTGSWLPGRQVLISPASLGQPEPGSDKFPINLTRDQIQNSPHIDQDKPVSRQHETDLAQYYGWPAYWTATASVGDQPYWLIPPVPPVSGQSQTQTLQAEPTTTNDPHLRSVAEVTTYFLHAADGEMGHAEDFIVETESWIIRYLVVNTGTWLPRKKVLIAPQWIEKISWANALIYVSLTCQEIKLSPEFDPTAPVNRKYEETLYDYYGRRKYWK
jgi:uncharacterized protein YrrD